MKKILAVAALTGLVATAAYAGSTPGTGVLNSVHDMNVISGLAKDPQGRVCAFCHTPHHALDIAGTYNPLWSHNLAAMPTVTPYQTNTFNASGGIDPLAGPSRLCMSCHDGVVAPDQHYGGLFSPGTILTKYQSDAFGDIAVGLSGDFSNDHPIGFSVANSAGDHEIYNFWEDQTSAGLKFLDINGDRSGNVIAEGLYPVTANAEGTIFTCATCHDVHNQDNVRNDTPYGTDGNHLAGGRNYLIYAPQSGSMFCLSCHEK